MTWLTDPHAWIAFTTLLALELVLGIDNVVFISILAGKLRTGQQSTARILGLGLAMLMRIVLLFCLSWSFRLTAPLFVAVGQEISGRDLIFIVGGLFLLGKGTYEMHQRIEGDEGHASARVRRFPVSSSRSCCWMLSSPWIPSSRLSAWSMTWGS
jgi:predicted tellurium resistance membrane protein TerC